MHTWNQFYGFDRFDLTNARGDLVAWVTRNRVDKHDLADSDQYMVNRDHMGYVVQYAVIPGFGAKHVWRLWWAKLNDEGFFRGDVGTDSVEYPTMEAVKLAAQDHVGVSPEDVKTITWEGNLTSYA